MHLTATPKPSIRQGFSSAPFGKVRLYTEGSLAVANRRMVPQGLQQAAWHLPDNLVHFSQLHLRVSHTLYSDKQSRFNSTDWYMSACLAGSKLPLTMRIYLNTGVGQAERSLEPSGDQLSSETPPPPARLRGMQLSLATSQAWNANHMLRIQSY